MSTFTASFTYTHTVTHVTTKMLLTLKEIIREIGLDPGHFSDSWESYERAISAWLTSRHLTCVTLEIYHPSTNGLVARWDIDVLYATVGDGVLWVDTSAIRYHIAKAGLVPTWCITTSFFVPFRAALKSKAGGHAICDQLKDSSAIRSGPLWRRRPVSAIFLLEPLMLTANEAFRKFRKGSNN